MESKDAVRALRSLAHGSRFEVFRRLVRAGDDGIPAGALAEALACPAPTLSFHLARLLAGGLVRSTRRGRQVRYALEVQRMRSLLDFLTTDCCQGRPDLCAPRVACGGEAPEGKTAARVRPPPRRTTENRRRSACAGLEGGS